MTDFFLKMQPVNRWRIWAYPVFIVGIGGLMWMATLLQNQRLLEHSRHPHHSAVHVDDFKELSSRVEVLESECVECLASE